MDSVNFSTTGTIKQISLMFDDGQEKMIDGKSVIDQGRVLVSTVQYKEVNKILSDGDEMCNFLKENKNNNKSNKIKKDNIMENLLAVKAKRSVAYGR
jgi:hypothetical protein